MLELKAYLDEVVKGHSRAVHNNDSEGDHSVISC